MSGSSYVTITGLDELIKRVRDMPKEINKAVDIELNTGSQEIAKQAKNNAPGNTGNLHKLIGSERVGDMEYNIYSRAEYSAFVEFGTGGKVDIPAGLEGYAAQFKGGGQPGVISAKQAIFAWCRDKGIEEKFWFAIYVSIMTNGIEPQPFFFRAKNELEPEIIKNVERALNDAI